MSQTRDSTFASGQRILTNLAQGWNRFWFQSADPTLLGFMRICCGLVVFYIHLAYTPDLQDFFGKNAWLDKQAIDEYRHEVPWGAEPSGWDPRLMPPPETREEFQYMVEWKGVNPRLAHAKGYPAWSIWYHVTDPTWMMVIHCGVLTMMFLFTIGFCTRVTSILTWLGALSYMQRSPVSLYGLDAMMNILLFYLMIGPSGAALSVDRLINRYWATWQALRKHKPAPMHLPPAPRVSANLALRLFQVHFCFIYLASGLSKLQGPPWWDGTAVWATMAVYEYSPMAMASYQAFLLFLAEHRWLWEIVMTGGVAFTLITEIGVPFMIWNRKLRWVTMTMAVMLHTGIAVVMGLRTFSLIMIIMLMAFTPEETVQALVRRLGRGVSRFRLGINDRIRGQVRAASVIRAFDAWDQVEVLDHASARRQDSGGPSQASKSSPSGPEHVELVTPEGETLTGYELFERLVCSVRLLWPLVLLTWIPGVSRLARNWFPGSNPTSSPPYKLTSERHKEPVSR